MRTQLEVNHSTIKPISQVCYATSLSSLGQLSNYCGFSKKVSHQKVRISTIPGLLLQQEINPVSCYPDIPIRWQKIPLGLTTKYIDPWKSWKRGITEELPWRRHHTKSKDNRRQLHLLDYWIRIEIGAKWMAVAKLRPPSYCIMPYQAFETTGFEHDLLRNEIKGR